MAAGKGTYVVREGCVVYVDGASHTPGQKLQLTRTEAKELGELVRKDGS